MLNIEFKSAGALQKILRYIFLFIFYFFSCLVILTSILNILVFVFERKFVLLAAVLDINNENNTR